jgi:hypothetical protein
MLCFLSVPRLKGTAALQVNDGYRSLDQNLEGVRSLGAALIDKSFVSAAEESSFSPIHAFIIGWFCLSRTL